jgi:phosphohistidine phosphatase SixA
MLNDQGKAEAAAIGAGFEANDIIIGKIITSNYCRAKDTATIAFGKFDKVDKKLNFLPFEDYTDKQLDKYHDRVAPMLSNGVENGNKIIVGHDDPFEGTTNIYPDPQGTAYVIKPQGDSYEIIAQLQPNDWAFGADI